MSNDTDHTPEDDLTQEHLARLIELLEHSGRKATGLRFMFECNPQQRFELNSG